MGGRGTGGDGAAAGGSDAATESSEAGRSEGSVAVRRKRAGAKAVWPFTSTVLLMFFVAWRSPARCDTKPCHLLSIYDLFSILYNRRHSA